jgi:hypothetical protein
MEAEYTLLEVFEACALLLMLIYSMLIYLRLSRLEKPAEQKITKPERVEYILCAAIWYDHLLDLEYSHQPKNINTGFVICGHRHHNCIAIRDLLGPDRIHVQGFLTNENRFVNRTLAYKIALAANQIMPESLADAGLKKQLYSEHLY